jgi:hypothetical protein
MSFEKEPSKKIEATLESISFLEKNEKITRYENIYFYYNLYVCIKIVLDQNQQSIY